LVRAGQIHLKALREGLVYYWPQTMQRQGLPPIPVRLLRLRGRKVDVWLITDVLEEQRLPKRTASQFYRWRWRHEMHHPDPTSSERLYRRGCAA
jgi:hypothetical protein